MRAVCALCVVSFRTERWTTLDPLERIQSSSPVSIHPFIHRLFIRTHAPLLLPPACPFPCSARSLTPHTPPHTPRTGGRGPGPRGAGGDAARLQHRPGRHLLHHLHHGLRTGACVRPCVRGAFTPPSSPPWRRRRAAPPPPSPRQPRRRSPASFPPCHNRNRTGSPR